MNQKNPKKKVDVSIQYLEEIRDLLKEQAKNSENQLPSKFFIKSHTVLKLF